MLLLCFGVNVHDGSVVGMCMNKVIKHFISVNFNRAHECALQRVGKVRRTITEALILHFQTVLPL